MPDDPNTDSESPYPDTEDWQIAFQVFEDKPDLALSLAYDLSAVKARLKGDRRNEREIIEALELAVDVLYEYTDFRRVSHELFRAAVEGRISFDKEEIIRELGIKI